MLQVIDTDELKLSQVFCEKNTTERNPFIFEVFNITPLCILRQSRSDVDVPSSSSSTVGTSIIDEENVEREVKAHMYIPPEQTPTSELLVKLSACAPVAKSDLNSVWSSPFLLVPSSGSTNVSVPKPGGAGAFLISATSVPVSGELVGRTRAIAFHPR